MISFTDSLICGKNYAILAKAPSSFWLQLSHGPYKSRYCLRKRIFVLPSVTAGNAWFFASSQQRIIKLCFCSLVGLTPIKQPMSHCENFATGVSKLLSTSSCLSVLSIDSCPSSFESICSSLLFFLRFGKKTQYRILQSHADRNWYSFCE